MRQKLEYLHLEIKKSLMILPRMFLQAFVLLLLTGMIAYCGVKSMERDPLAVSADIAVVVQEDNRMTRMALQYVENMESVSQICHFRYMTEKEGFDLLEKGEAAALILLPEQLVEGIMNGANPAIEIYFPKNAGLEAWLFRELTESGEELLRVAQAQIYGANDTAARYGLAEQLSQMEAEIDSYNLAFALDRLALYDTENVSVFGAMNAIQFYMASGFVLFLLLAGMAIYPVLQREPLAFCRQLERQGMGAAWQCLCQWLCGVLCTGIHAGVLWAIIRITVKYGPDAAGQLLQDGAGGYSVSARLGIMMLIVMTVTAFIYLLHSLAGNRTSGILLVFLFSFMLVYLSGGLVPSMFLPKAIQAAGRQLPTAYLMQAACGLLTGRELVTGRCVAALFGYTAAFGGLAYFIRSMGK